MPILRPEERLGSVLSERYRLDRILGKGGMGVVFAGTHTWTGRPIAVKALLPQFVDSPDLLKRFFQEARAAAALKHPNVIDVLDMGEDDEGEAYIVLEYLEGEPMSAVMERSKKLDLEALLAIVLPVMDALCEAHAQNIVHRDLKPDNIFIAKGVRGRSVPKLLDFGISKLLESQTMGTGTGSVLGTLHYMSPEQAAGAKDVDGRSDVFSMGVVLYHALTGRLPFEAETATLMLVEIIGSQAPTIRDVAPELHPAVAAVIDHSLQNKRAARIESMSAFTTALVDAALEAGIELESQLLDYRTGAKPAQEKSEAEVSTDVDTEPEQKTPEPETGSASVTRVASAKRRAPGPSRPALGSKPEVAAPVEAETSDASSVEESSEVEASEVEASEAKLEAEASEAEASEAKLEAEPEDRGAEASAGEVDEVATSPEIGSPIPATQHMASARRTAISSPAPAPAPTAGLNMKWAAGGAVLLALLGGAAFIAFGADDVPPTTAPPNEAVQAATPESPPAPLPVQEAPPAEPPPSVEPAAPATVERLVISDPLGAEVRIGDELVGETPVTLRVPADGSLQLTLSKRGYDNQTSSLSGRVSGPQTVRLTRTRRRPSGDDLAAQ